MVSRLLRKFRSWISGEGGDADSEDMTHSRHAVLLFLISGVSVILVFLSNYVLIKLAGPGNYGSYIFVFNLVYLLAAFGSLGLDTLFLKKTVLYHDENKRAEWRGLWRFGVVTVILGALVLTAFSRRLVSFSDTIPFDEGVQWYAFMFVSLCTLALTQLAQSILQARGRFVWSQAGEKIMRPFLLVLLTTGYWLLRGKPDADNLLWINWTGILLTLLLLLFVTSRVMPFYREKVTPRFETKYWMLLALSFFAVDFLYHFNARIHLFLLGVFNPSVDMGIFNISLRVSELTGLMLTVVNIVIAPQVTQRFARGDLRALQALITRTARLALVAGTLVVLAIVLFRQPILRFFDDTYLAGETSLLICCIGQFVNVFFGSVGILLVMTGHQKYSIVSLVAGMVLGVVLNLWLTPRFGINGTAVATSAGLICWNLAMYYFVRRHLRIRTTGLGIL